MSCVFKSINPPPTSPPSECVGVPTLPPAFVAGGGHTRRVERGVGGGQYFGRRKTQLYTLPISNPLWSAVNSSHKNIQMKIQGPALTTVQCCGAVLRSRNISFSCST
jgi:hypothetical protein